MYHINLISVDQNCENKSLQKLQIKLSKDKTKSHHNTCIIVQQQKDIECFVYLLNLSGSKNYCLPMHDKTNV